MDLFEKALKESVGDLKVLISECWKEKERKGGNSK